MDDPNIEKYTILLIASESASTPGDKVIDCEVKSNSPIN